MRQAYFIQPADVINFPAVIPLDHLFNAPVTKSSGSRQQSRPTQEKLNMPTMRLLFVTLSPGLLKSPISLSIHYKALKQKAHDICNVLGMYPSSPRADRGTFAGVPEG